MDLLMTLLIGLVVGALAKFLMPGDDPGGIIITIIIGIAGAFVGKFLTSPLGISAENNFAEWVVSILGAMLLLFLYRMVKKKGPAT